MMSVRTRWRVIAVMVLLMWLDVGHTVLVWLDVGLRAEGYPPMPSGWWQWATTAFGIALLSVGSAIVMMEVFRKPRPIVYGTDIE